VPLAYTPGRMDQPPGDISTQSQSGPGSASAMVAMHAAPEQTEPVAASPPATDTEPSSSTPAHKRRRLVLTIGFVIVAIATCGVLIAVALTQEPPRWWGEVNAKDPKTIATAEAVENGVASALTQVRPVASMQQPTPPPTGPITPTGKPGEWKVFITNDQANAWLNVRLKAWLADQTAQGTIQFTWPEQVGELRVNFADGRIAIGAKVWPGLASGAAPVDPSQRGKSQTLAAELRPEFKADGALWMTAEKVNIGRLPLPASWVLGGKGSTAKGREAVSELSTELASLPQTGKVLTAFSGAGPVLSRPIIKLADGRRVRLVSIEPWDGKLVITCRTEGK